MPEELIPLAGILSMFGTLFGVVYLFLTTRNRERLAMIEKGIDAKIFYEKKPKSYLVIKIGMAAIGIGIGIFFGKLLVSAGMGEEMIAAMMFVFGGIGLVIAYFIESKLRAGEKKED